MKWKYYIQVLKVNTIVRIEKCAKKDDKLIYTRIDMNNISKALSSQGIKNSISEMPTAYLCNEAYYYMLKKMNGRAVFIHIPSMKNMTEELLEKFKNTVELMGKKEK